MAANEMVPMVAARSLADIERIAMGLIRRTCPDLLKTLAPFPLAEFMEFGLKEAIDFELAVQELPSGCEAETEPLRRLIILSESTYNGLLDGNGRDRFTCGHEVGHAVLHVDEIAKRLLNRERVVRLRRSQIKRFLDPEWQANSFASALLMPSGQVQRIIDGGGGVRKVMSVFNVSSRAAEVRISKVTKQ